MHHGKAIVCGANATTPFQSTAVCVFLPTASGTITINKVLAGVTTALLSGFAVTAGVWVDLGFYVGPQGGDIVTAGGAAGTLVTN